MTATLPQPGPPASAGGPVRTRLDARPGTVYGYPIRDPQTGTVRVDYVGQTRNLARRDAQHRGLIRQRDGQFREQPWSDLIDGGPVVLQAGVWTDAELDAAEIGHMHRLLPRMNYRDSVTPDRIPIYTQREQRDARDVAKGLPVRDWNAEHGPGLNHPVVSHPTPAGRPPLSARLWATRAGRRVAAWLAVAAKMVAAWAALATTVTALLTAWAGVAFTDAAGVAAVLVAVGIGWVWNRTKRPQRRGRNRSNRNRRM